MNIMQKIKYFSFFYLKNILQNKYFLKILLKVFLFVTKATNKKRNFLVVKNEFKFFKF